MARKTTIASPEHEELVAPFSHLHFDPRNPRGDFTEDEGATRLALGADARTIKLAAHMAEHGQNPLDKMGVVKHPKLPGHFVVREGNRRLCAMQLLRDPARAATPALRKTYEQLAAGGRGIPNNIPVVLFNEAPRARVWMSVKHEGEQGGLGTLPWGPEQKAKFNTEGHTGSTRPKNPNRQAVRLLDYAVGRGLLTPEQRAAISLTTITRYLPAVRAALGLLNNEDCTTNADQAQFDAGVQHFLLDALAPKGGGLAAVNSESKTTERTAYAESLRRDGFSPVKRTAPAYDPATVAAPAAKASKPRSSTNPALRKVLIPAGFIVTAKDTVLRRMVIEGKELDPDRQRFSANYLNRAIMERVVHLYARKHGVGAHGEFSDLVARVVTDAKGKSAPPSKGIATTLGKFADKRSAYSYEVLGGGVHGGHIPSGADNKSNWESLQPALAYLLSKLA